MRYAHVSCVTRQLQTKSVVQMSVTKKMLIKGWWAEGSTYFFVDADAALTRQGASSTRPVTSTQ